jgi:hypothetical protein
MAWKNMDKSRFPYGAVPSKGADKSKEASLKNMAEKMVKEIGRRARELAKKAKKDDKE